MLCYAMAKTELFKYQFGKVEQLVGILQRIIVGTIYLILFRRKCVLIYSTIARANLPAIRTRILPC